VFGISSAVEKRFSAAFRGPFLARLQPLRSVRLMSIAQTVTGGVGLSPYSWNTTQTPLRSIAANSLVPQGFVCSEPL